MSTAWRMACVALVGIAAIAVAPVRAATITIQVKDAAGEGFNDATPFTPIGGNNATTLGAARLNVFREAARLWGALINSSQPIIVEASFDPLDCQANTGVLGSAGPVWMFHDFPNRPKANVFYAGPLAEALAGSDLSQGLSDPADITASFNSTINGTAGCLGGGYLYYGFDHQLTGHNDGRSYIADLLAVVLHELGHGLGFLSVVDSSGNGLQDSNKTPLLSAFDEQLYEESTAMYWPQMTAAQRAQSATGQPTGAALVWNGAHVNGNLGRMSAGLSAGGHLRMYAPTTFDASSSVSHWDTSATPNLLMEPQYTSTTGNHADLTTCALYDMGWTGNRCPDGVIASDSSVNATAGTSTNITLKATDGNGDALTYAIVANPAHGTLGAISGAVVAYTPSSGYTGDDTFTFRASDALVSSNVATVTVHVAAASTGGGSGGGGSGSSGGGSSGGGGGGALDGMVLALLAGCRIARARSRRR